MAITAHPVTVDKAPAALARLGYINFINVSRLLPPLSNLQRPIAAFFGFGQTAPSLLWPRWLVLRGIGLVYVVIFAGIIVEGAALVGPQGIAPIAEFCARLREVFPSPFERFLRAPSLFWFVGSSPLILTALPWLGLSAAVTLVFNFWPRLCLFTCWAIFLSFVSTWQIFTASIDDQLMLEVALLAIHFAPAGMRPGLGKASPPAPIAIFAMRFLLFRVMFEAGVIKLIPADSHWRNLTAMDALFQSSPAPTVLGYLNSRLPHPILVAQIALTFVAEIVAPLVVLFGGARWRWFAFFAWTLFQAGIQATINFGWLNTVSIALGILLLDDAMLAQATALLRWPSLPAAAASSPDRRRDWSRRTLCVALGLHAAVSVYFFAVEAANRTESGIPPLGTRPVEFFLRDFHSANCYIPFASFPEPKYEVEFAGSNDGGQTWRPYEFRFKPQREDAMSPFFAPWFSRFEASLQLAVYARPSHVEKTAGRILSGNPDVIGLFRRNPFPDRPPTQLRMLVFQFSFVDWPAHRATGRFWNKELVGDLRPPLSLDAEGRLSKPGR